MPGLENFPSITEGDKAELDQISKNAEIAKKIGEIDIDETSYVESLNALQKRLENLKDEMEIEKVCRTADEMLDEMTAYYFQREKQPIIDIDDYRKYFINREGAK